MDLLNGRGKKCKEFAVLPVDVITDILTRQPVKSLLRFRCVSKPFCALIDSPYFIKKHLNHSIESQTNHKLIMIDRDSINSVDLNLLDQALEIKRTPETEKSYKIIGSVNGLVCLITADDHIVVWNLATKNCHIVSSAFDSSSYYAFGYDSVYDDYKIVSINQCLDRELCYTRFKPDVYSLRSNSWQTITQDFPYHVRHYNAKGFSVLVCGALHWCVKESRAYNSSFLILAIDLATNCFSLVAHPDTLDNEFSRTDRKLFDITIGEVGGHLCVVCKYWKNDDVWLMKNYQVKESWIKLCSLSRPNVSRSIYYPFAYSKKRDKIMLLNEYKKLVWYDLKKKIFEKIEVRDCPYGPFLNVVICVESLVPPTPEGGIM